MQGNSTSAKILSTILNLDRGRINQGHFGMQLQRQSHQLWKQLSSLFTWLLHLERLSLQLEDPYICPSTFTIWALWIISGWCQTTTTNTNTMTNTKRHKNTKCTRVTIFNRIIRINKIIRFTRITRFTRIPRFWTAKKWWGSGVLLIRSEFLKIISQPWLP